MADGEDQTEVSELINVREFLVDITDSLPQECFQTPTEPVESFICRELKIPAEMGEELNSVCGPATLDCPGVDQSASTFTLDFMANVHPEVDLSCTGLQKAELEKRRKHRLYRNKISTKSKYKNNNGPWLHALYKQEAVEPENLIEFPEVILIVKLYKPYNKQRILVNDQEFYVYGQQGLCDLRDKIQCANDQVLVGEFSDNPELPQDVKAKDLFKSGFFYIEGTFYNDMRDLNCRDYSKVITDWAKDPSRGVGPFQSCDMEKTSFLDISFRLGQPYVYTHQGDCEHLLVFSDIRLMHSEDCRDRSKYPIQNIKMKERRNMCRVCHMYAARWVTRGSKLCPEEPGIFCDSCFKGLHYSRDGQKLTDFKAYPMPNLQATGSK